MTNFASEGKPWWLNGRDCYRATFLGFASRGEDTIPIGLVELEEPVALPGHKGRYAILRTSYGSNCIAWEEKEGTAEVHLTETLPEDASSMRGRLTSDKAVETHATYRVGEPL